MASMASITTLTTLTTLTCFSSELAENSTLLDTTWIFDACTHFMKQVFLSSAGGIINPQTTSGRILVAAAHGEPVVSSVYGEWIASFMIDKPTFSLSRAITYLFPAQTQDFYIAALDPIFDASASGLKRAAKMPTPLLWLTMFGFDILLAASFICYSLANTQLLVALAAVAVAVAMASQARK